MQYKYKRWAFFLLIAALTHCTRNTSEESAGGEKENNSDEPDTVTVTIPIMIPIGYKMEVVKKKDKRLYLKFPRVGTDTRVIIDNNKGFEEFMKNYYGNILNISFSPRVCEVWFDVVNTNAIEISYIRPGEYDMQYITDGKVIKIPLIVKENNSTATSKSTKDKSEQVDFNSPRQNQREYVSDSVRKIIDELKLCEYSAFLNFSEYYSCYDKDMCDIRNIKSGDNSYDNFI